MTLITLESMWIVRDNIKVNHVWKSCLKKESTSSVRKRCWWWCFIQCFPATTLDDNILKGIWVDGVWFLIHVADVENLDSKIMRLVAAFSRFLPVAMTRQRAIVTTVISALLIDLLAFTIILPLFPRLLNYYREQESNEVCIYFILLQPIFLSFS